jgi:hypothetical protein
VETTTRVTAIDHDLTARLVDLAGRPEPVTLGADLDPHRVAETVLAEVLSRAALLAGPPIPVTVQFELLTPENTLGYLVSAGAQEPAREGWVDTPDVLIRQDLAELVRAVFGPADSPADRTRRIVVRDEPPPRSPAPDDPAMVRWQAAQVAAGQVVAACSAQRHDLAALALRFGSDKWGGHWYTPHYERHFAPYADRPVRVLEIGIGGYQASEMGGASLRMWKHYFRRGLIHGLDIADKSGHDETRVRTIQGDQSDVDFLVALNERHGPFDIVVDDGSHLSEHVIVSMTTLFPLLRHGGLYVVEDLETSYWPAWNGGRTDPGDPGTSVGFLKSVVDELLTQDSTGFEVAGMHFYHNMVVMEKGANREQSAPAWVRG